MNRDSLSTDQFIAYTSILNWFGEDGRSETELLTLGGFAGSGKSTLLSLLVTELGPKFQIAVVTYTGKASQVVRKKLHQELGVAKARKAAFVGTIHSFMYRPVFGPGDAILGWDLRDDLGSYDLIVIDEASMVPSDMVEDLLALDIPILAVGDHGQLPPIGGSGSLMQNPDLRLEKIHRQAESNPIIRLSALVRSTGKLDPKMADGNHVIFKHRRELKGDVEKRFAEARSSGGIWECASNFGLIAYTNATRTRLNSFARQALGFHASDLRLEDVVMCLKNTRSGNASVSNGMRGRIRRFEQDGKHHYQATIDFPDEGISVHHRPLRHQFGHEKTFSKLDEFKDKGFVAGYWSDVGHLYDYGYAITAHKAQGSQYEEVAVVLERPFKVSEEDWTRWQYTSCTRAVSKLVIYGT